MKKLHLILLAFATLSMSIPLYAQGKERFNKSQGQHEARISVFDYTTRSILPGAGVFDTSGKSYGKTNKQGQLTLKVPSSVTTFYVIKADGYSTMNVRLTQADKPVAEYDFYLPKSEGAVLHEDPGTPMPEKEADLVKVYVKQEPEAIQKSADEGQGVEFAVQLSATSRPITDKSSLRSWEDIGPVFIHSENGLYKVRIGPYHTQEQAKQVLLEVKAKGKKDAFIVVQRGIENHIPFNPATPKERTEYERPLTSAAPPSVASDVLAAPNSKVEYKVRLASYLKPGGFNTKDIDKYGPLESYRKGDWTIMLIGGFKTARDAERVRDAVIAKGYTDAKVVVDRDGVLETEY